MFKLGFHLSFFFSSFFLNAVFFHSLLFLIFSREMEELEEMQPTSISIVQITMQI